MALGAQSVEGGNITYTYTGNPFTNVSGTYTTSDFVSGSITLATPLPANDSVYMGDPILMLTPTAFSYTDGVDTITNLTPNVDPMTWIYSTDSTGDITSWIITLPVTTPGSALDINSTNSGLGAYDRGTGANFLNTGAVYMDPGQFTVSPEPTSLVLIPSGLLALALIARKRKARAISPSHN